MNAELKTRLEKCTGLPTLPSVAVQVLQLCQDEDLDFSRISEVTSKDPALAVKLLKLANSPVFGFRQEVSRLSQALALLGANTVRGLVLSFFLARDTRASRGVLTTFWRRSVLAALAARQMYAGGDPRQREEAFLAALLQDIGVLAFYRAAGNEYDEILKRANGDHDLLSELERMAFGDDHVSVGVWLLERWHVPARLNQVILASHEESKRENESRRATDQMFDVVALSGRFADIWIHPDPGLAVLRLRQQAAVRFADSGLNVDGICTAMVAAVSEVSALFDVEFDAQEMTLVVEQAQEALVTAVARLESSAASLRNAMHLDSLTGLPDRGQLEKHLEVQFRIARAGAGGLGVVFIDVDHFKNVNDSFGHCSGDMVLKSVAQQLKTLLRTGDFVGRFGGEEFVVVATVSCMAELSAAADRLRVGVASMQHPLGDGNYVPVTISLGCAVYDASRHQTAKDVLDDADHALYAAKEAGRNRVEPYSGPGSPVMAVA